MSTRTACTRRPFETTRVSLLDAREASALAGFFSRRVKPHALRHTEQSIWMDQARRHGRALGDTRTPRRWAMAPSNESIPSEGEAARKALFPQVRASLVLAFLRFLLPFCGERAEQLTILFSLFDGKLKKHSESPMVYYAERWINRVRTLRIDARSQGPIRLHRSRCPSTACKSHPRTFIPPQGIALVCSDCETTETSRWCTNKDDKDKPVCVVCYKRQACHARRSHASIFHHLCVVTS